MRVLVVSAPLLGHVFPLVPLSRALAAVGHDVLLTRLVTDPALAAAAVEVRREMAAMPAGEEIVPELVALTR